jgi:Cu+-exporting ATPase
MRQVRDPVCGVTLDTASAVGRREYLSREYYFCSPGCLDLFTADPSRFVGGAPLADMPRPAAEPPHTTTGPLTAPKFGSAGSGGLEFEPLPESPQREK